MTLLPFNATQEIVGKTVLNSLRGSRDALTEEEAESAMQAALKCIGERSWDLVEKHWNLVQVAFEAGEDTIMIIPMKPYETGGYVGEEDDLTYSSQPNPLQVGEIIMKIIHGQPPKTIAHTPSHT